MRRTIAKKGTNETLKNFELCKKNLKVNSNIPDRVIENELEFENKLKEEFYDGILSDLLEFSRFEMAKIVYGERMKEKIEFSEKTKLEHKRKWGIWIFFFKFQYSCAQIIRSFKRTVGELEI